MKDFAIYTAIVGGYDIIRQPLVIDEHFDYILFSNDIPEERVGVWQIRSIPYQNDIQTKIARWVKTHPEKLLPDYKYTVWMDSNIQLKSSVFYNHIEELADQKVFIACRKHPERDCIYDEATLCAYWRLDDEKTLLQWWKKLRKNNYPHHNGLFETTMLFRKNCPATLAFDNQWWQFIERYSRRDQLSFNYTLWIMNFFCHTLLPDDFDTDNSIYYLRFRTHGDESLKRIPLISENYPFLYWYLKAHPERNNLKELGNIRKYYDRICATHFPMQTAIFAKNILRVKLKVKNILHRRKETVKQVKAKDYANWIDDLKTSKKNFVNFTGHPYKRNTSDPKIYAFYLTQFHAIPENDKAHGKGFTEWTNVAAATPQFIGHYQPKIPYDLGFYNLLMPGVLERQVEIAKAYGIYGFCFYYYWFSGRKLLEKPLEYFLQSDIDFHFHLCWATENWSKLWDGGDREIIVEQKLKQGDADKFFYDILPYISDSRYEQIEGRPVLIIYRVNIFSKEQINSFIVRLDELAIQHGFKGFHILCTNAFGFDNPLEYSCKGLVEFPPHGINMEKYSIIRPKLSLRSKFNIVDLSPYIAQGLHKSIKKYPVFKTCFPEWDNTPRKLYSGSSCILVQSNDFHQWLSDNIIWTREHHNRNEQIVYINAWNEWGEGAILEPTTWFGYRNLDIVKKTLETLRDK